MVCVYYCSTYFLNFVSARTTKRHHTTKLFAWGGGGHVLRETTNRGLGGLVCPSRHALCVCLLLQDLEQNCVRGEGGDIGGHVLRETTRGLCGLVCPSRNSERGGEGDCVKEGGGGEGKCDYLTYFYFTNRERKVSLPLCSHCTVYKGERRRRVVFRKVSGSPFGIRH
jgi:hypothetical protein